MANAYEEERARRVAQNRARLEELMLKDLARAMAAEGRAAAGGAGGASKAVKAERAEAARKRRAERAAAAPERKSRRVSENPALQVKYNQTDNADITGKVWRRRGGGGAESGRSRALRLAHAGADVWPPRDAVVDAMCAADDVVAKLKPMRAWVKVMSPSQVSGGFWMQLPKESYATFASYAKETIFLQAVETDAELGQSIREANGKSRENDPSDARWPVVLLPRPKGAAGLSGGWRGTHCLAATTPPPALRSTRYCARVGSARCVRCANTRVPRSPTSHVFVQDFPSITAFQQVTWSCLLSRSATCCRRTSCATVA